MRHNFTSEEVDTLKHNDDVRCVSFPKLIVTELSWVQRKFLRYTSHPHHDNLHHFL